LPYARRVSGDGNAAPIACVIDDSGGEQPTPDFRQVPMMLANPRDSILHSARRDPQNGSID
jgi:hypothetical protein